MSLLLVSPCPVGWGLIFALGAFSNLSPLCAHLVLTTCVRPSNVVYMRTRRAAKATTTYQGRTLTTLPTGEVEVSGRRFDCPLVARMAIEAGLA